MGSKQSQISVRLPDILVSELDTRCLQEENAGGSADRQELIQFFVDRHIQNPPPFRKPSSILTLRHPLNNILTLTLNTDSLEYLKSEAESHGITPSSMIRLCIYEGLHGNEE